jgi:hypothetical protein
MARRPAQAADKLPAAPILTEDDAQPWRRGNWAYESFEDSTREWQSAASLCECDFGQEL